MNLRNKNHVVLSISLYKYAFRENSKTPHNTIAIHFSQIENSSKFHLLIQDNGIGLPENFDVNKLSSFGMQLVQGLVGQLHGSMKIIQEQGVTFEIYLEEPLAA